MTEFELMLSTYRGSVYPWHCDQMGHMNVMWYVGKFDEASWQLFAMIGLTTAHLQREGRIMGAVDQQISYLRELFAGDVIEIRSEILEMRPKAIRFRHQMRNAHSGEPVATTVLTAVHIDREVRRSCPFPEEICERARTLMHSDQRSAVSPQL